MALTYPLSLPDDTPESRLSVVLRMDDVVAVSQSPFTFQTQVQAYLAARWRLDLALVPLTRSEAGAWLAFLAALRGRLGTCHVGDPARPTPLGTGAGAPVVAGAGQAGQQLVTAGWAASQTVLTAGDYVQLGSGAQQRLYLVLADVTSDAAGGATLDLWPPLRESPADAEPLVLEHPKGTFRLASNTREVSVDRALRWGIELAFVEAL